VSDARLRFTSQTGNLFRNERMTTHQKADLYRDLVACRKRCRLCKDFGLLNPSKIGGGRFDSDRIGPYTLWQGNLDARLVVVGQDFANVDGFLKYKGWPGHNIQTNLNLVSLLRSAGISIPPPDKGHSDDNLFFTNAVLCMKQGNGRQARVPTACFRSCGQFLRRTLELVRPRLLVTLGSAALRSVWDAFECPGRSRFPEMVGHRHPIADRLELAPMYHPSPTVVRTHRSLDAMRRDWQIICGRTSPRKTRPRTAPSRP